MKKSVLLLFSISVFSLNAYSTSTEVTASSTHASDVRSITNDTKPKEHEKNNTASSAQKDTKDQKTPSPHSDHVAVVEKNNLPPASLNPAAKTESVFQMTPHIATYDIVFDREKHKDLDADGIRDIQGNMTIKLIDAVDGWIFEQHTVVFIYYDNDQPAEQIRTTIVTWESKDGERYDFKVRTVRNDQEDNVSGKAFAPKNLIGFVEIDKPDPIRFDLPKDTSFPLAYLSSIINTALQGDFVAPTRPVFDVSNESLEPVDAMASISSSFNPKINSKDMNSFKGSDKAWEVRYTIFPLGGEESQDDDFEMRQTLLANGVIAGMTMDVGKTNTKLVLKKVEFLSHDASNSTNDKKPETDKKAAS